MDAPLNSAAAYPVSNTYDSSSSAWSLPNWSIRVWLLILVLFILFIILLIWIFSTSEIVDGSPFPKATERIKVTNTLSVPISFILFDSNGNVYQLQNSVGTYSALAANASAVFPASTECSSYTLFAVDANETTYLIIMGNVNQSVKYFYYPSASVQPFTFGLTTSSATLTNSPYLYSDPIDTISNKITTGTTFPNSGYLFNATTWHSDIVGISSDGSSADISLMPHTSSSLVSLGSVPVGQYIILLGLMTHPDTPSIFFAGQVLYNIDGKVYSIRIGQPVDMIAFTASNNGNSVSPTPTPPSDIRVETTTQFPFFGEETNPMTQSQLITTACFVRRKQMK